MAYVRQLHNPRKGERLTIIVTSTAMHTRCMLVQTTTSCFLYCFLFRLLCRYYLQSSSGEVPYSRVYCSQASCGKNKAQGQGAYRPPAWRFGSTKVREVVNFTSSASRWVNRLPLLLLLLFFFFSPYDRLDVVRGGTKSRPAPGMKSLSTKVLEALKLSASVFNQHAPLFLSLYFVLRS